jgi:hypothetical protein
MRYELVFFVVVRSREVTLLKCYGCGKNNRQQFPLNSETVRQHYRVDPFRLCGWYQSDPYIYLTVVLSRCKDELMNEICLSVVPTLLEGSTGTSFVNILPADLNLCKITLSNCWLQTLINSLLGWAGQMSRARVKVRDGEFDCSLY